MCPSRTVAGSCVSDLKEALGRKSCNCRAATVIVTVTLKPSYFVIRCTVRRTTYEYTHSGIHYCPTLCHLPPACSHFFHFAAARLARVLLFFANLWRMLPFRLFLCQLVPAEPVGKNPTGPSRTIERPRSQVSIKAESGFLGRTLAWKKKKKGKKIEHYEKPRRNSHTLIFGPVSLNERTKSQAFFSNANFQKH